MKLLGNNILDQLIAKHSDCRGPVQTWRQAVLRASWKTWVDIKAEFSAVSILKSGMVVWNIKGNKYRIVASVGYQSGSVAVEFAGTHKDYDKLKLN